MNGGNPDFMKSLLLKSRGVRPRPRPSHNSLVNVTTCSFSNGKHDYPSSSLPGDTSSTSRLHNAYSKAPFQRVGGPALFPWRHSPTDLPRLDEKSMEFAECGQLLGGNVYSSNPTFDAVATAWFFLNVPWYRILLFRDWQDETAENMSWAFTQGVSGILSNVYQVPYDEISKGDFEMSFDYSPPCNNKGYINDSPTGASSDNTSPTNTTNTNANNTSNILENTVSMIEPNLQTLYKSAHEFGKDNLQVRLECRPTDAKMYSLFAFPFLSRASVKRSPAFKEQYLELLEVMTLSPMEAMPIYRDLGAEMQMNGRAESTVICQVVLTCEELFWVKDLSTGAIIQGFQDETFRTVKHLVRMEMVVETIPRQNSLIPFEMHPGSWQITDIDDHLQGNLIL